MTVAVSVWTEEGHRDGIDPSEISEWIGKKQPLLWVDVVDATDDDFTCLQREFDLHHLAMEDAQKHGQRPKVERYPTHAFVVAYTAHLHEVDVFVGPDWLVTIRERGDDGQVWEVDGARRRFERSGPEEATPGFLLYTILDELVDGYFTRTDAFEDALEAVEETVFEHEGATEVDVQEKLYGLRRELIAFRRRIQPLREVVNALLRREVSWIDDYALTHLQDVYDHVLRVVEQIDTHRELMNNVVDAHLAIISNRMNQVMKKMTSWGAILLGSTLIAGIYGMNFDHMPELRWRLGYPFALGLMLTLTVAGYRYFKRRDWL